jgi:hypothetical protein
MRKKTDDAQRFIPMKPGQQAQITGKYKDLAAITMKVGTKTYAIKDLLAKWKAGKPLPKGVSFSLNVTKQK